MKVHYQRVTVLIDEGNITEAEADAITNPANSLMLMGGGVAGAIKRAAGVEVEEQARQHAPVPVGAAAATSAGRLKVKYVIHAPTMERPGPTTREKIARATKAALESAERLGLEDIVFPGMGTGVGGVPASEGCAAMLQAIKRHVDGGTSLKKIALMDLNREVVQEWKQAASRLLR